MMKNTEENKKKGKLFYTLRERERERTTERHREKRENQQTKHNKDARI
jgi:hypothetical protein